MTTLSPQAQAKQTIAENVLKWTQDLCDWLEADVIHNDMRYVKRNLDESIQGTWEHQYYSTKLETIKNGEMIPSHKFVIETGRRYHKIIMLDPTPDGQKSVHAFVDKNTGEVYKPAGWRSPAKHVRYDLRLIRDRQVLEVKCDWAGGYLYMR